jgi:large subunit ribosomal protein L6
MSRVLKPVDIPSGITIKLEQDNIVVKGSKGELKMPLSNKIAMILEEKQISFKPKTANEADKKELAMTGTIKALVSNMIIGVTTGFEKKLDLVGVGYRAQAEGNSVTLNLGFSHPIKYQLPEGITAETPKQTELIIRGIDKQKVGQVSAEIRGYRPPEPYKGKGVRYTDEHVVRKEAKKK